MYKLLGGLKDYFKLQEVQTDNAVFRLHNLFTTALLLACSLIITATQYVGQPISCIVNGVPPHVVNTFCWISSTFTMPDAFQRHVSFAQILCTFRFHSLFRCVFVLFCSFSQITQCHLDDLSYKQIERKREGKIYKPRFSAVQW